MRIACVSDSHGMFSLEHVPDCRVLVIAGDYCPNFIRGSEDAHKQLVWLSSYAENLLRHLTQHVIIVAGNHDWVHQHPATKDKAREVLQKAGCVYLEDSDYEIDCVKFYGSPWQPWFYDWAFNFRKDDIKQAEQIWSQIPIDTDVLITHGPPHKIRDRCPDGREVGCPVLRKRIDELELDAHIFGHIHDSYGITKKRGTIYVNSALCDEDYVPKNKVQVIEVC